MTTPDLYLIGDSETNGPDILTVSIGGELRGSLFELPEAEAVNLLTSWFIQRHAQRQRAEVAEQRRALLRDVKGGA